MTQVGSSSAGTSTFSLTRNEIIEEAYRDLNVLADGENLPTSLLSIGIKKLNKIVREHDVMAKHLWAISATPNTVPLVANQFLYTTDDGLSDQILYLIAASYRDAAADDHELTILTTEQYESLPNKMETGDPTWAYLTEDKALNAKQLYLSPMLSSVNTQSVVTGDDSQPYRCIQSHTADSTNQPTTGANYLLYWELTDSGSGTWTEGTSYTAPQLVRLWYKRPLYDFNIASDNPDYPTAWTRYLGLRLCQDLAPGHNVPMERIVYFRTEAKLAYESIFRTEQPRTTKLHDLTVYM